MGDPTNECYSAWRDRALGEMLHDGAVSEVPERALQVIWQHQRLDSSLRLADGRPVRVLHPGFWNHAAGPDFRRSIISIDGGAPRCGDVEVDVRVAGWRAHGHDTNPAFADVMLRVVWEAFDHSGATLLGLRDQLDTPWPELRAWALREPAGDLPERLRGACCKPMGMLDASQRHHLLGEAGRVRLRNKSEEVTRRAGSSRWREALFLGLFTALGYKQNVWPMRRIAEAMLRLELREKESQAREELLTAMMLGLGGLIPDGWPDEDPERSEYLKRLWSLWWRLREGVSEHRLPPAIWRMDGVRPVNRPERRLALAACWLSREDLEERLEAWARADLKPAAALTELWGILATDGNRFWETRCTFTSRPMARAAPLLGRSRLTELAMNAVLPWSHARARACGDEVQIRRVEQRYLAWPKAEDNAVLRLARQRLLGMRSAGCLRGAGQQQGLLQIVRDFCARGDALCSGCRFPAYVEGLRRGDR